MQASYVSSVAVSPTGAYVALGDADGTVHLMSASTEEETVPFNGYSGKEIEWADSPAPLPDIVWNDST